MHNLTIDTSSSILLGELPARTWKRDNKNDQPPTRLWKPNTPFAYNELEKKTQGNSFSQSRDIAPEFKVRLVTSLELVPNKIMGMDYRREMACAFFWELSQIQPHNNMRYEFVEIPLSHSENANRFSNFLSHNKPNYCF